MMVGSWPKSPSDVGSFVDIDAFRGSSKPIVSSWFELSFPRWCLGFRVVRPSSSAFVKRSPYTLGG